MTDEDLVRPGGAAVGPVGLAKTTRNEWVIGAPALLLVMLIAGALCGVVAGVVGSNLSVGFDVIVPILASIGGVILGLAMAVLTLGLRALLGRLGRGRVLDTVAAVLGAFIASLAFFLVFLSQQNEWKGAVFVVISGLIGALVETATLFIARRHAR